MKITIVTVYNSLNCGSYLQARQLYRTLRPYAEVALYDSHTRGLLRPYLRKVKRIAASGSVHAIRGALFELVEMLNLRRCWRKLPHSDGKIDADLVLLGSDEIWNVTRKACRYPVYWGAGISAYKAAYGPSVNQAQETDFEGKPEYAGWLEDMNQISVRDAHSQRVIGSLTDREIPIVLDPTLLERPEERKRAGSKPYVAVYLFYGALTQAERDAIIRFARGRGLELVSAGQYISWCDRCVHAQEGNPFAIFQNAEYVISNTFHGTAYAVNYRTRFAALVAEKPKAADMLAQLELQDRIVRTPEDIERILETDVDYERADRALEQAKEASMRFIHRVMEGCKDDHQRK